MIAIILWLGLAVACGLAVGLSIYGIALKRILRIQRATIATLFPEAIVTGAQSAAVTTWALRRIGRAKGTAVGSTGPVYSIAVSLGWLRLFRGRQSTLLVEFSSSEVVDVRVGTTSVGLADYTTLFFGIRAGETTFELPVRMMGQKPSSIMTASRAWGDQLSTSMVELLRR